MNPRVIPSEPSSHIHAGSPRDQHPRALYPAPVPADLQWPIHINDECTGTAAMRQP